MKKLRKPKWRVSFRFHKSFYKWFGCYFIRWLGWKDKFDTPRVEREPQLLISFLWFQIDFIRGTDDEWEWWLWVVKYCDNDINKAKETWPWYNYTDNTYTTKIQGTPWLKYNK